jgi:Domain of unknown function (DUF6894)
MPRYFFALTDQDSRSLADDEVGEDFDRVEAAREHAMAVARELSRNQHPSASAGLYISVVDEGGIVVFEVPL